MIEYKQEQIPFWQIPRTNTNWQQNKDGYKLQIHGRETILIIQFFLFETNFDE